MIDRKMFCAVFDSLARTPGGQPFIAEEGQLESVMNLVNARPRTWLVVVSLKK